MSKIVVVGGGIAGLSAAYYLHRGGCEDFLLLESSARLGGKVGTTVADGLVVEHGPDSVFTRKPWAVELMVELGLEDEIVESLGSGFSIFVGGRLHPVPSSLASLMPSASGVLEKVGFFSAAARRRILKEPSVAKGGSDDESVASFFRRRFGRRFSTTLAEPLLAGVHAGDPERLSMRALYPTYLGLEESKGSLTGTAGAPRTGASKRGTFVSLRSGLGVLIERLVEVIPLGCIRTGAAVQTLRRNGSGVTVVTTSGDVIEAGSVAIAAPAHVAARLLADAAPAASAALGRIRFISTAVITFAFSKTAFPIPLPGNGFLVPNGEGESITGCTCSSVKWPYRAQEGTVLLRIFIGRDGGLDVDSHSEVALIEIALEAVQRILKSTQPPIFQRIDRWSKAMPQYELGHLGILEDARNGMDEMPVHLIGSSYGGNGIPDCVRQGREFAETIIGRQQ